MGSEQSCWDVHTIAIFGLGFTVQYTSRPFDATQVQKDRKFVKSKMVEQSVSIKILPHQHLFELEDLDDTQPSLTISAPPLSLVHYESSV